MTTPPHDSLDPRRGLVEAHHALRQKIHDLLATVDGWSRREPDQDAIDAMTHALRGFTQALLHHFAWEEKDGYMRPLVDHAPQALAHVERLREDHDRMRAELKALNDRARETTPRNSAEFGATVKSFLSTLHEHESREDHLVQETFYRDSGLGD